jgi:glycosyltransferase involved in cell wall biosynthesis
MRPQDAVSRFTTVIAALESELRAGRRSVRRHLGPKLGVLSQHPPRKIAIPAHYGAERGEPGLPRISVVTPSFQQAGFLEAALTSVLDQSYGPFEYVVQDGASTDGTKEILERYSPRLTHWESTADGGQADALNRGFRRTTGDILAYVNSDDLLLPGSLAYVARFFADHADVDVVYGHRILVDEEGREIGRWVLPPHDGEILSWADYVPQETLFWRRSLWQKVGNRFDPAFRFALDWDLLLRFRQAGARFRRLPRFLGAFRVHPEQKTSSQMESLGLEEMARLRTRSLGRHVGQPEITRHLRPYLLKHFVLHKLHRLGLLRY